MATVQRGSDRRLTLDAKYTVDSGSVLCSGVQALVRVVFDQLRTDRARELRTAAFVSGYPGSPLGGFDRELTKQRALRDELHVHHVPGHNEELAASSVGASQLVPNFDSAKVDGVVGFWYGKAPGLDRAGDAIRHAQYIGTARTGGVVAFLGDDPACKSSTLPSGSEPMVSALQMPMLEPSTVADVIDLGLHAVALSRASGLWSVLRVVSSVADGTASFELDAPHRPAPIVPTVEWQGQPYLPRVKAEITGAVTVETEAEISGPRLQLAREYAAMNGLNQITVDPSDAWLGIISRGTAYEATMGAFAALGLDEAALHRFGIRVLHMQMVSPIEPGIVRTLARGLSEIIVIEEKRAFLEPMVRDVLYGATDRPLVIGKRDEADRSLVPLSGTLSPDDLVEPLRARLTQRVPAEQLRPARVDLRKLIPVLSLKREAYFCSGCPHNSSTVVPDGALVGAGIGCHSLASRMDPERFGVAVVKCQMGGEGAGWIAIEPFIQESHLIQNIGDGTYFHSGQLAVQAAVSAGSNITFKLLYNGAIAMTGGQDPAGSNARPVNDVAEILLRQGVNRVLVTTEDVARYRKVRLPSGVDVWDRSRIIEAQEVLAQIPGVTVLIHDQMCATELRRGRKRGLVRVTPERIMINERVCEGCGDCGAVSNCLSVEPVETDLGRKTQINQTSCNHDLSCVRGDCPAFITVIPDDDRDDVAASRPSAPAVSDLPAPPPSDLSRTVAVRMPGIGGTGVVTVNQILGTAALLDGLHVAGVDQTGLSQKAGPVVSDLRIGPSATAVATHQGVDVYLALDLLGAADPNNLAGLSVDTFAIVSTTRTPTGTMVSHVDATFPELSAIAATVDDVVGRDHVQWIDAQRITTALLGDAATANVLVLGVAVQSGHLPVSPSAVEEAIELNGVVVQANLDAFRWGRQWAIDPASVEQYVGAAAARGGRLRAPRLPVDSLDGALRALVERRADDLIDYQHIAYARRFIDDVTAVAAAERAAVGQAGAFTEQVARHLYKLMAYKDEYEVARLLLDDLERGKVTSTFGTKARVTWNLHPPMLRAMGLKKKLALGTWARPGLAALRAAKRLRGTVFDPFHWAQVRTVERQLIDEYRATVLEAARRLDASRIDQSVRLAALPDIVRGYEQIKLRNVETYHHALRSAQRDLGLQVTTIETTPPLSTTLSEY